MLKRISLSTLFILMVLCSCEELDLNNYDYTGIVQNEDHFLTCSPEVCFVKISQGLDKIDSVAWKNENWGDSIYSVLNFPEKLRKEGLTVKLKLRMPDENELPSCYQGEMPIIIQPKVFAIDVKTD
ncbi:MAG: hypothetical protein K9J30_08620 [Bacteroidales bacterium]|nr:hypothetical protein [Bacteroidales bacterium]